MTEGNYLYFEDGFDILETELKDTLDETHTFFKNYEEINPADSTLKIETIINKISELKQYDEDLRNELTTAQIESTEEVINNMDTINIINKNEQYDEVLKDKIYMYNHHTSYGIFLFLGICSMAYLSQPARLSN